MTPDPSRPHPDPRRRVRARSWAAIGIAALAVAIGGGVLGTDHGTAVAGGRTDWTVYHGDPAGSGAAASVGSVTTTSRAWTSRAVGGQIYGAPLVFGNRIYVATEDNRVAALAASTGRVIWSRRLATPVPARVLPCGNIGPTVGITGTPVIDPARHEIFVVADELIHGRPRHVLVGLDTAHGARRLSRFVDPPGANPAVLLQRTGLTLDAGQVVFGMSGNYGDCGDYRGRVIAVRETGGAPRVFTVDAAAGQREGGIWMGGAAPVVDRSGNIWVGVGNGSVTSAQEAYDHSDAVLELSPSLRLVQYFAPSSWAQDNADDLDLSMAPALMPGGAVLGAGKSRTAYLLHGAHLGGIGGEQATLHGACAAEIVGGSAVSGATAYLPCLRGPVAVQVTTAPAGLTVRWRARVGAGPPILAGGRVWTIDLSGVLYGLDPATGAVRQQAVIGTPASHFPTPSVGAGLLLATSATRVVAFHTSP